MATSFFASNEGASTDVCSFLMACLAVTGLFVLIQLVRIMNYSASPGSFRKGTCFYPWTVQKQVHTIIFFSAAARIAFLVVASFTWDSSAGQLSSSANEYWRQAFYISDELPVFLFFSLGIQLALFLAEIHHNAEDTIEVYYSLVKPALQKFHAAAYIGWILFLVGYATLWRSFDYYILNPLAYYIIALYVVTGILLIWNARLSVQGVLQVPIEIQIRRRKFREIWTTTLALVLPYIVRITILGFVAGEKKLMITTWRDWIYVFVYYWLLENLPVMVILHYFHRMPVLSTSSFHLSHQDKEDRRALTRLLGGSEHEQQATNRRRSASSIGTSSSAAIRGGGISKEISAKVTAEMIESSIRRISIGVGGSKGRSSSSSSSPISCSDIGTGERGRGGLGNETSTTEEGHHQSV